MIDCQKKISGIGCLSKLAHELSNRNNLKNVLLVTGKRSFETSGAKGQIDEALGNYIVRHVNDFEVNPKCDDLIRIKKELGEFNPEVVLAIGGGSVLDMAKLLAATIFASENTIQGIVRGATKVSSEIPSIIAVPTSAGSGSEATHFAVCYIGSNKYSVASQSLLPELVLLDGALLKSGSQYLKTCTALDALAQSIESNWAVSATKESRGYSATAFKLALENIAAFSCGDQSDSVLQDMIEAANEAGKAINISKTTAAHAWSYGFTSKYGIPHGHAVWLTLPKVFEIHMNHAANRENVHEGAVSAMNEMISAFQLAENITISEGLKQFLKSLGVVTIFQGLGIHSQDELTSLSQMVNQQRMENNPVQFSAQEVEQIFDLSET